MLLSRHADAPGGARAVKNWTSEVILVEIASALRGGGAPAASASEQVPCAEVALQQLNISDRISLLRPEGRRSNYREISVLRLPVPAAALPASPAQFSAPLQQSHTSAAASSAADAQELEVPTVPDVAAVLPRALSKSPPNLQSARRVLRAWTPQEGIPERALLPSSPTPSLMKVSHAHAATPCPDQAGPALQANKHYRDIQTECNGQPGRDEQCVSCCGCAGTNPAQPLHANRRCNGAARNRHLFHAAVQAGNSQCRLPVRISNGCHR